MSENRGNYGRDGDIDSEIADILSEVSEYSRNRAQSESISEMAHRYGVDVGSSAYAYEGDRPPVDYGSGYRPYNRPREQYDEKGARIVFDADNGATTVSGRIAAGRASAARMANAAEPSVAERRRILREQQQASVHVVYDADTSSHAAKEAPFENIGERETLPPVSDGKENRKKKTKKEKTTKKKSAKPGELTKTQRVFKTFIPWTGDSKREYIRKIVMDVSFVVLLICALYFMDYFIEYNNASKNNPSPPEVVTEVSDAEALAEKWAGIRAKYPGVDFPEGMNIAYADLYAQNQDFVGWISIDNTPIDSQVVQSDDNEYYLKHDFRQVYTRYGSLFMDYRNNIKELDDNTLIYGHHMRDGLGFAKLEKYKTVDGYKESPIIEFNTLYKNYKWKVFAVFLTNNKASDDNGYMFNIIVPNFHTRESYMGYIDAVNERSLYSTGVDVLPSDKILTLITCDYNYDDERLVVIARQVRDGEKENVDFSKIVANENPRYPQKWYDVMGLSNPYRDAYRWRPNE